MKFLNVLAFAAAASALPAAVDVEAATTTNATKNVIYVQTFHNQDGSQLSLLPLIQQKTRVTHVILAALHLNDDPNDIHLNDDPPNSTVYKTIWPEVKQLQGNGTKVTVMLGGAAQGSYQRLQNNFTSYYPPLRDFLKKYALDGIDLDIEEQTTINATLRLLKQLNTDFGKNFLLTMAPVATDLQTGGGGLSGFSYFDLDAQANAATKPNGKLVNWYNAQCYNGWGDASTPNTYQSIISSGWSPERVVMGVADSSNDGGGWVSLKTLAGVIKTLRGNYTNFGGVDGWEYFDAGVDDGIKNAPWTWVKTIGNDLFNALSKRMNFAPRSARPLTPYEPQMAELMARGVGFVDSLVALNRTAGNLPRAKAMLKLE